MKIFLPLTLKGTKKMCCDSCAFTWDCRLACSGHEPDSPVPGAEDSQSMKVVSADGRPGTSMLVISGFARTVRHRRQFVANLAQVAVNSTIGILRAVRLW